LHETNEQVESSTVQIEEQDRGFTYFEHGDFNSAFTVFEMAANEGDVVGQMCLSFMYENGFGVKHDQFQAFEWCVKAFDNEKLSGNGMKMLSLFETQAEQGNETALCKLGVMYMGGIGVAQDVFNGMGRLLTLAEAGKWYLKSAEQGYSPAKSLLGALYGEGKGEFVEELAEQGHEDAQFCLGAIYGLGRGVDVSFISSFEWIDISAKNGSVHAIQFLKENGIKTPSDISHALTPLANTFNHAISIIKKQE